MTAYAFLLSSTLSIHLGANVKTQAIKFAICLALGIVAGVASLLYFRKSSAAERFLTDLFATLVIGGGYIGILEFVFGGKFELYGLASYLAGVTVVPCIFKSAQKLRARRATREETVTKN